MSDELYESDRGRRPTPYWIGDESSLRAELAEAKAEIARLEADNDKYRRDFVMIGATVGRQREIVEAAKTVVPKWTKMPIYRKQVGQVAPQFARALDALVTAVEEGDRTDG